MKVIQIVSLAALVLLLGAPSVMAEEESATGTGRGGCGMCGRGGQGPNGEGCPHSGPDLNAAATVSGTVLSYEGGPGEKMPTLTLIVEEDWLELFVGPNRLWLDAGFEVAVGQELEVTYAPAGSESHLVALSVTDKKSGETLTLRDSETGRPAMASRGPGRGQGRGPGEGLGRGQGRGRGHGQGQGRGHGCCGRCRAGEEAAPEPTSTSAAGS